MSKTKKILLMVIIFFVGVPLLTAIASVGTPAFINAVLIFGLIAAMRAVWKYNPQNND